ncbi:MAG TPA: dynamin family protein [Anaerolineales bacterium]|nr:dynamin family protein [Anaerolineales bacterium]
MPTQPRPALTLVDPTLSGCYNSGGELINMRILNEAQEKLLNQERGLLGDLRVAVVQFGAAADDQETLAQSIQQLDDLFLLVVVGEFNAGKSAFINALLGQKVLKEGVTPTTTQINMLRHGPAHERLVVNEHLHTLTAPVEMLAEISIVDTPGTNAIIREHETITSQFVPRSDLVLFITSADRPFTESERAFLEKIRDWGKKVVVVLNKIDLFQGDEELEQVQNFITENARALFGITPEVFPVSARLGLRAKLGEPALWLDSRFEQLEGYIHDTLDERGRLRLKFLNPLGVGMHLVEKYLGAAEARLDLLKADFATLDDVDTQLAVYKEDMQRDFNYRMADIENVLFEMEQRGQDYFDETLRVARVFDLLNKSRIQSEFEHIVVGDAPQHIEAKIASLIDWLVDSDLRQWQAVSEHLAERRRQHKERIVGEAGMGTFHHDRERLIEGVGRASRRVVDSYDKASEAEAIADGARNAVAALAAVQVGAVGLGTLVAILATTAAADVTGVLLASLMAALGFFVIPARRRQAKAEMRQKIGVMREQLVNSLRTQFESEIERSLQRINEAIAPYTRFVRAEQAKLNEAQAELVRIKNDLTRIKVAVEEL